MTLTTQGVLDRISEIHKELPMYGHPLWTGMVEGTWNLEQSRYICQQHGGIPLHNHNYHGNLYVICPDPAWRELIAEVAFEEATGRLMSDGVSHHRLYLNYARGMGLKPEQMYDPPYCAGVVAFQAYFTPDLLEELSGRCRRAHVGGRGGDTRAVHQDRPQSSGTVRPERRSGRLLGDS